MKDAVVRIKKRIYEHCPHSRPNQNDLHHCLRSRRSRQNHRKVTKFSLTYGPLKGRRPICQRKREHESNESFMLKFPILRFKFLELINSFYPSIQFPIGLPLRFTSDLLAVPCLLSPLLPVSRPNPPQTLSLTIIFLLAALIWLNYFVNCREEQLLFLILDTEFRPSCQN